jgi:hypothetical protein
MDTIEERALIAEQLWILALDVESHGDYLRAYDLHTEAHNLIMDCANLRIGSSKALFTLRRA